MPGSVSSSSASFSEPPAKRQRKSVQKKAAFCIVDLADMDTDKFAVSDLGAYKSKSYTYPKAFYNDKVTTFKLKNVKLIKVRDQDKRGNRSITVAVEDPDVISNIGQICGETYPSPLFGDSGDLLGVELVLGKERMPFEIYNNKGKLLGSDLSVLEYGQTISLKLFLNAWHSLEKEEDGSWASVGFGFKTPQIKIVEAAQEAHKSGVCEL